MIRTFTVVILCVWILVACAAVERPDGRWNDWCARKPKPSNCWETWTA